LFYFSIRSRKTVKINGRQIELQSNYTQHADNLLQFEDGEKHFPLTIGEEEEVVMEKSLMYILASDFHFRFRSFRLNPLPVGTNE
jgi:hypothetical protein